MFDSHVHSCYSVDSNQPLDGIYEQASALGLKAVAVTDHYDIDMMHTCCDEQVLTDGYAAIKELSRKTEFNDTELLCGIELGAAIFDEQKAKEIISTHDYDVVLSSLHGIMGNDEYYLYPWGEMSGDEIRDTLAHYFTMLEKQAKQGLFDVLAHLDYPVRYIKRLGIECDLSDFDDMIDRILRILAENGKALEINTRCLFDSFHTTQPGFNVIKRFHKLGGEFVSYGSDSHTADMIATHFADAAQLAQAAGFACLTYFKKRSPISVKI